MIEYRVLGTLDLRDASDGRSIRSVLSQPKRTALLAYLAVATPRGPHRRDTLLALFWPESSEERARNSLNQAVFKLRRSLGEEAIDRLGDGAVALGSEVWCDAAAFEGALDAGDRAEALELYRGDLLPGFHVSGCPRFERWLERERARLRDRAVEAALELARVEEEKGNGVGAVRWLRRASSWAPYREPVVRHLVELLGRLGDRAGAVREYRKFRERLERDLAVEPSAETDAVVREISQKSGAGGGETDAGPGEGVAEKRTETASPKPSSASRPEEGGRPEGASEATDRKPWRRRWAKGAALAMGAAALAVGAFQVLAPSGPSDAPSSSASDGAPWFEEQDAVLVADFRNRTGDPSLDGVLEPALARTLSSSPFVTVASRRRVTDALRLMRLPPDTSIDARTARRIALRDPGIRAVLAGAIRDVEDTLVLSVEALAPEDGQVLASWSEAAGANPSEILGSARRVSLEIREYLGENLDRLREEGAEMQRVTTSSLRALRLYDEAEAVIARFGTDATSEELLREAVREDPHFASAHLLLFYAIRNQGGAREEALHHLERAMELSDGVSDRERYFIRAVYHQHLTGDSARAVANYRALLRLHPDHYWANSNLAHWLGGTEAIPLMVRKARFRPNDLDAAWDAAHALAIVGGRPEDARPFIDRVVELAEGDIPPQQHYEAAWARLWDAHRGWRADDLQAARSALDRWAGRLERQTGPEARWTRRLLVRGYRSLGLVEQSAEFLPLPEERLERRFYRGLDAFFRGDVEDVVRAFGGEGWDARHWTDVVLEDPVRVAALARIGRTDRAREIREGFRSHPRADTPDLEASADVLDSLMTAEIARAEGRIRESAESLEELVEREWEHYGGAFFLAVQALARSYRDLGRHRDAAAVLQRAGAERERSYPFGTELWMDTRLRLARLQRELGRAEAARRLEAELRELTRLADEDFWLVRELERGD